MKYVLFISDDQGEMSCTKFEIVSLHRYASIVASRNLWSPVNFRSYSRLTFEGPLETCGLRRVDCRAWVSIVLATTI